MNGDSSVAARVANRWQLLYIFLFALLIRLSVFSLAVALGEGSYSLIGYYDLETYVDFTYYYVPDVSSFIAGLTPYQQFSYAYPPFFLYILVPFALFSLPSWTMALPLVVFDAATVIPVFLIANKLMNPRRATIASIAFAVAPVNLYYVDFIWLNSSPVTFFVLLAVYWFLSKKHEYAFISLAIATLFKQTAFILFPVFTVALLNESNRMNTVRNVAIYGTTCFIGSLPYVVTIPADYFSSLGLIFFATGSKSTSYNISSPTNLGWVFGSDAYVAFMPFLLGALLLSLYYLCLTMYRNKEVGDKRFVTYVLYAFLLFNALLSRGIYKYYLAGITPLCAVFVRSVKTAALFLGLNVLLLLLPRILTPWFVLSLLILPLIKPYIAKRISSHSTRGVTHESSEQAKVLSPDPPSYN